MNVIELFKSSFGSRAKPEILTDSRQLTEDEMNEVQQIEQLDWDNLDCELLKRSYDVLNWLSPEAFMYYLPRICAVGVEGDKRDFLIYDSLLQMLDRSPNEGYWDDFFKKRFLGLSKQELTVIQEWIFWLTEEENLFDELTVERSIETLELVKNNLTH
ncbi:hypothetical protein ACUR5C_14800 [Aliikangiella sp. IMCC44653]